MSIKAEQAALLRLTPSPALTFLDNFLDEQLHGCAASSPAVVDEAALAVKAGVPDVLVV